MIDMKLHSTLGNDIFHLAKIVNERIMLLTAKGNDYDLLMAFDQLGAPGGDSQLQPDDRVFTCIGKANAEKYMNENNIHGYKPFSLFADFTISCPKS